MTPDAADDPRVLELAREYLAELEAGRSPDRAAFLARYPELSDAVAECLDGMELAHAIGKPTAAPPAPPPPAGIGEPLGDFRIVREIGRGGMGVVYEAVQLSLGRRVALKVLPFAAALDARHLQRFRTEAHAAAQLHHSNIVPVYAVGCERGMHFYAMQLIDGRPLDAVIRELRGEPDGSHTGQTTLEYRAESTVPTSLPPPTGTGTRTGRGREAFRTAARIAAQVADALDYAHESGVIHRDIKPANLLLDPKGTVWVADFGLAQVTTDAGVTQTGDVLGTIRYMSPEQAAGRRALVDHRTDVYSLGATLYELLALEPIFPGQDRQALLHEILTRDPRPPRAIDRAIPVELETIVLKAVAKSPAERYATAGEMAADLRRFLDDRPILARRPTVLDRARKWVRRHPSAVGAAVLLLAFAAVGMAAFAALAQREQGRTKAALDREKQRAAEAEERFQLARRSADQLIRLAEEETADTPQLEGLRKQLLTAALGYYQEFIAMRRDDPAAQTELAATRDKVRRILADLAALQSDRQLGLLNDPAVLDDLKLTDDQRTRLTDRLPGMKDRRFEAFDPRLAPDERAKRQLEMARTNGAEIGAILTPDQDRRLGQLALQMRGPMAFREPEVAAELHLTAEQREQIRRIEREEMGRVFGRGPGGPGPMGLPPGPRQKIDPRAAAEKILTLLTPDQLAQWKKLTGEPFAGPLLPFVGPGGPPRPFGPPDGRPPRGPGPFNPKPFESHEDRP